MDEEDLVYEICNKSFNAEEVVMYRTKDEKLFRSEVGAHFYSSAVRCYHEIGDAETKKKFSDLLEKVVHRLEYEHALETY